MADSSKQHARIVSRAWQDPTYKQRLLTDPAGALAEEGITVPAGTKVQVHENTSDTTHIVLPSKPAAHIAQVSSSGNGVQLCIICAADGGGQS